MLAWTVLLQHPADAHYIATMNVTLVTNHILGVSKLRYQDLTPLNILIREYVAAFTRIDSPIASTKELLARLRKDPASVSFGFSPARGNQNHIVLGMIGIGILGMGSSLLIRWTGRRLMPWFTPSTT